MKIPKYVVPLSVVGTAVGAIVLLKDKSGSSQYLGTERIPGRTVIVTGATSGIGKETAKELAHRGARVILACRNMPLCEEVRQHITEVTYNKNVQCQKLDLASMKSIRAFADAINSNEKRVDILINNAGVMESGRTVTLNGFETHLGINYLGPFLLTNLLLDKLKASAPSRIINVIGLGYNRESLDFRDFNQETHYNSDVAYKRSKLALAMFTHDLSIRLEGTGVTVVGVHPGAVYTKLRDGLGARYLKWLWFPLMKTPVQGAQTTLYCALEPSVANLSGHFFEECQDVPVAEIVKQSPDKMKRLWMTSEHWTRLKD